MAFGDIINNPSVDAVAANFGTTPQTITFTTTPTSGNLIIVTASGHNGSGGLITPAGYSVASTVDDTSLARQSSIYYKISDGTETSVDIQQSQSTGIFGCMYEVEGTFTGSVEDSGTTDNLNISTIPFASVTSAASEAFIVGFAAYNGGTGVYSSVDSGFTANCDDTVMFTSGGRGGTAISKKLSASGTETPTITLGSAQSSGSVIALFELGTPPNLTIDSNDTTMTRNGTWQATVTSTVTAPTTGNTTLTNGGDTLTCTNVTGTNPYTLTFDVGDLTKQVSATGYDWTLTVGADTATTGNIPLAIQSGWSVQKQTNPVTVEGSIWNSFLGDTPVTGWDAEYESVTTPSNIAVTITETGGINLASVPTQNEYFEYRAVEADGTISNTQTFVWYEVLEPGVYPITVTAVLPDGTTTTRVTTVTIQDATGNQFISINTANESNTATAMTLALDGQPVNININTANETNTSNTVALTLGSGTAIAVDVANETSTANGITLEILSAVDINLGTAIENSTAGQVTAFIDYPPTLTNPTGVSTGADRSSGTVTTDEGNGILYGYASLNPTETSATIIASGQSQAISSVGSKRFTFTGLTEGATYYNHYVHVDNGANESNVVSSTSYVPTFIPVQPGATNEQMIAFFRNETGLDTYSLNELAIAYYKQVSASVMESFNETLRGAQQVGGFQGYSPADYRNF